MAYDYDYNQDDLTSDDLLPRDRTVALTGQLDDHRQLYDYGGHLGRSDDPVDPAIRELINDGTYFHEDVVPSAMGYQSPDYEALSGGMYDSPLCRRHRKQLWDRQNLLQDSGRDRIRCRQRAKTPNRIRFEQDRYINKVLDREGLTGTERDVRREELEGRRDDKAGNAKLIGQIMDLTGKSRSWAYSNLKEFKENGIENTLISKAIPPRPMLGQGTPGRACQCVRPCESATSPLPARQPCDPRDEILQAPIDRAAVRRQLEADTARFLSAGATVNVLDPWYPPEEYMLCGEIRPLPFNRWGK